MSEEENPGNPEGLVTKAFCDERTKRIEQKIEGMEDRILNAIRSKNDLSWKAKATILGSFILGVSSVIVAVITVFG